MLLKKDEAVILAIYLSHEKVITSVTKLNKLLARFMYYMVPVDIDFSLNKYGSFTTETKELISNDFYKVEPYEYRGGERNKFILTNEGEILAKSIIKNKVLSILNEVEFQGLKEKYDDLSQLRADEISDEEHRNLLVDVEDRDKLIHRINEVHVDMLDLFSEKNKLTKESIADLRLAALIEYSFYLSKYLKEKRFKNIESSGYDFDSDQISYFFLWNLEEEIIPFLKDQLKTMERDEVKINKYYQYLLNIARHRNYPFSLDNENLIDLIK